MDSASYTGSTAVIGWDNVGEDVKIQIGWIDEPVSLARANASITAGRHSWTAEYVDVLGWYQSREPQDSIASLTEGSSDDGSIRFTDENGDNYLDDGDYFVVSDLTRPTADSAVRTYLFRCQWPMDDHEPAFTSGHSFFAYLLMTNNGVVRIYPSGHNSMQITPQCQLLTSMEGEGRRFTVSQLFWDDPIEWSDTQIIFSDGVNHERTSIGSGDLLGTGPITKTYPDFILGDVIVTCSVTDMDGNDWIDKGDFLIISPASGSFKENTTHETDLIFRPTGERAAWSQFRMGAQPRSNISVAKVIGQALFECTEPMYYTADDYGHIYNNSMDVAWSEVVVRLSDGSNSTSWSPPLDGRRPGSLSGSVRTLGGLTVGCVYGDLQGNGFINRGDNLVVAIYSGGDFSPSQTYSLTIEYAITGELICAASYTG